jgi:hypothetical protein
LIYKLPPIRIRYFGAPSHGLPACDGGNRQTLAWDGHALAQFMLRPITQQAAGNNRLLELAVLPELLYGNVD